MNWNDELCGVKVTPESWTHTMHGLGLECVGAWQGGAIIEFVHPSAPGAWEAVETGIAGYCRLYNSGDSLPPDFYDKLRRNYRPVFPQKGWAGKTDAELCEAVFGTYCLFDIDKAAGVKLLAFGYDKSLRDAVCVEGGGRKVGGELPALILALQNAQVLARRLQPESSVPNQTV